MTAAEYQALAAQTAAAVASVEAITTAAITRSFDPNAPLPPLNIRPTQNLWEPAAVHYRDLEAQP